MAVTNDCKSVGRSFSFINSKYACLNDLSTLGVDLRIDRINPNPILHKVFGLDPATDEYETE